MEMAHMGLTPYESFMVSEKASRRPSGSAVAGLVLGSVGTALAVGAWIFGPVIAGNRSRGVEKLVEVSNANTNNTLNRLASLLDLERSVRPLWMLDVRELDAPQGVTLTQTVTDTVSGSQQSALTAQQAAELSAVNSVMQQTFSDAITGRSSLNPTPVNIYSAPQPCGCPCGA